MAERLRAFLERPLDPRTGRAVLILAAAVSLGFAGVVALGAGRHGRSAPLSGVGETKASPLVMLPRAALAEVRQQRPVAAPRAQRRQDPQDVRGSLAAGRSERELRTHSALQHVPYRHGAIAIVLVGARDGWALLRVSAPTVGFAKRGWRAFLSRFHDDGRAYLVRFHADRRVRGHG
jgi:hypothetical protein